MHNKDFEIIDGELVRYHGHQAVVHVPDGVVRIGREAFTQNVKYARRLVPPTGEFYGMGLTREEDWRMAASTWQEEPDGGQGMDFIREVILPPGVLSVGDCAFYRCRNLEKVTFPKQIRSIGKYAFSGCTGLRRVILPLDADTGRNAFEFDRTEIIRIPWKTKTQTGLPEVADFAIDMAMYRKENKLTRKETVLIKYLGQDEHVVVPDGVVHIGEYAFVRTTAVQESPGAALSLRTAGGMDFITEIDLPEGVEEIDPFAFYECWNLRRIRLPESLRVIGRGAFRYCSSLTEIKLPPQLKRIRQNAFTECLSLTRIEVPEGTVIEDGAFNIAAVTIVRVPKK